MPPQLPQRSQRKRDAIVTAATELFLTKGYAATSMDEVAAAASASKQTVYKHFTDKESLFREIVMGGVTSVSRPFQAQIREVEDAADVPGAVRDLARRYIKAVTARELLRRRLLVVREAGRLPDLARAYHDGAPVQTIRQLATTFGRLAQRGELTVSDPEVAARHFAFLVLGSPLDTAMFRGKVTGWTTRELNGMADAATDVFLAAYGPASRLRPKA
ncbi:MAG TPA: TetR/AcrR family transcriptional regulator [Actinomycetales bacterium]|nr:TetR/AcrR family transcriptional regulator [Actinomycetales bacterium]